MKYLKRIELKDISINNTQKEISKSYEKGKEYYEELEEKKNNDN